MTSPRRDQAKIIFHNFPIPFLYTSVIYINVTRCYFFVGGGYYDLVEKDTDTILFVLNLLNKIYQIIIAINF